MFYYDLWILAFIHKDQHKLVLTHGSLYQFCGELDPHIWVVDIPRSPYRSKTNPDSSLALRFSSAGRDEGTLTAFILLKTLDQLSGYNFGGPAQEWVTFDHLV